MSMGMIWLVFGAIFVGTFVVGVVMSRRGGKRERVPTWRGIGQSEGGDERGVPLGGEVGGDGGDDLAVYREVDAIGVDWSVDREVRFYSYFGERLKAEAFGAEMADGGFGVELREPGGGIEEWAVVVARVGVVEPHVLLGWIDAVRGAAVRAGGIYDGYEIGVS